MKWLYLSVVAAESEILRREARLSERSPSFNQDICSILKLNRYWCPPNSPQLAPGSRKIKLSRPWSRHD